MHNLPIVDVYVDRPVTYRLIGLPDTDSGGEIAG